MSVVPLTKTVEIASFSINIAKITGYLLKLTHPIGGGKAKYFLRYGFTIDQPLIMMDALINHAKDPANEVAFVGKPDAGTIMVVVGILMTPNGPTNTAVRAAWLLEDDAAAFLSAYPVRRKE